MEIDPRSKIDFEVRDAHIETRIDGAHAELVCRPALSNLAINLLRIVPAMSFLMVVMGVDKIARGRPDGGLILVSGVFLLVASVAGRLFYYRFRHVAVDGEGFTTWFQSGPFRWGKRAHPLGEFERLSVVPTPAGGGVLNLVTRQGPTRLIEATRRVWAERAADTINEWVARRRS